MSNDWARKCCQAMNSGECDRNGSHQIPSGHEYGRLLNPRVYPLVLPSRKPIATSYIVLWMICLKQHDLARSSRSPWLSRNHFLMRACTTITDSWRCSRMLRAPTNRWRCAASTSKSPCITLLENSPRICGRIPNVQMDSGCRQPAVWRTVIVRFSLCWIVFGSWRVWLQVSRTIAPY